MTDIILEVKDLTVGYKKPVLSNLSFKVIKGMFVSLLGPNGGGKTTLLRTISRHIEPISGKIFLKGQPISSFKPLDFARVVSVVLTDRAIPPLLSVLEFTALGRYPHLSLMGRMTDQDYRAVEAALAAVKAVHLADCFIDQLSDGELQKAILARALAQEPELMILDEPTSHLDLKHRVEVMGILRSLCSAKGLTVIAALHDVDVAAKISDQVLTVRAGQMTASGRPEEILSSQAVKDLYDFDQAGFSRLLGGVEVRGDGLSGRAFVVSGRDRTAMALRLLSKRGYALAAAVPDDSDLDAHVAKALGGLVFSPTSENKEKYVDSAKEALGDCSLLVDGLGEEGPLAGRELVAEAKRRGLPVLSLDNGNLNSLIAFLDNL
ncbi:MAG: ABC transporter ATP-binding protein [Deltaproteobacteria bacterium]|jgi:iron complex transport system ATP-binding protein|nr:ABC transporter ATP-binding protein [Deltaproteobacteria bacterium]